jgi:hypothetical protein
MWAEQLGGEEKAISVEQILISVTKNGQMYEYAYSINRE